MFDRVAGLWRAADYWTASLQVRDGATVHGYAKIQRSRLDDETRDLLDAFGGAASFTNFIPDDAMVVLAGRFDLGWVGEKILDSFAKDKPDEWVKARN
ncbi:MAG: hypothetical protein N2C14_33605, partial [Planctomycetales bacterium]